MSGFVVYGFKDGARRYYGGKLPFTSREQAAAVAQRVAESALRQGGRAQVVVVEPVDPEVAEVVSGPVTAESVVAAIDANVAGYDEGRLDYDAFHVRQRVAWDAARRAGVDARVAAVLRGRLP